MLPENETQSDFYIGIPVNELQNATNQLLQTLKFPPTEIWKRYLKAVFDGYNITLDLDKKDMIYVDPEHLQYLFMIAGFLTGMPDVLVEVWVWWMAVNALIINTTMDIKEYFEKLSAPFHSMLLRSR